MDNGEQHALYEYLPIVRRPRISWPNDARVALWIVPNIEHHVLDGAYDVPWFSRTDYGNRVGLWRMFEVMDKHAIRCTVSLSMSVIEMYPEILEAMEARRWEYMSHGYLNTRYHWGYSEEEERDARAGLGPFGHSGRDCPERCERVLRASHQDQAMREVARDHADRIDLGGVIQQHMEGASLIPFRPSVAPGQHPRYRVVVDCRGLTGTVPGPP